MSSTIKQRKDALRKEVAAAAAALTPEQLRRGDEGMHHRLTEIAREAGNGIVFCYISVGKEPDTRRFIGELLAAGRRVCVPRCLGEGIMEAREITSFDDLLPAGYNLLEPADTAPLVAPGEVTLAVIPCVAAGKDCRRLGHGAGYYDRYLPLLRCPTVCLCRAELTRENLPQDEFDRRVDMVLTQEGVYKA